ncbi:unnamed protein product [Withania somnifera]
MDSDSLAPKAPRKVRFAPKGPPRRPQKTLLPEPKVKSKVEKKGPTQVAFGYGGSSSSMKSYVHLKGHNQDYYTNYPVTLPLRRPYSGNQELLDEEEFGEASQSSTYDENSINPTVELGLMEENLEEKMFFVQLPPTMPMLKQSVKTEGSEMATSSKSSKARACMYKSGAVKMKLGETLYNVSPGMDCSFAQDVVVVSTEEKYCSNIIGELTNRVIRTPDVDSILDSI